MLDVAGLGWQRYEIQALKDPGCSILDALANSVDSATDTKAEASLDTLVTRSALRGRSRPATAPRLCGLHGTCCLNLCKEHDLLHKAIVCRFLPFQQGPAPGPAVDTEVQF